MHASVESHPRQRKGPTCPGRHHGHEVLRAAVHPVCTIKRGGACPISGHSAVISGHSAGAKKQRTAPAWRCPRRVPPDRPLPPAAATALGRLAPGRRPRLVPIAGVGVGVGGDAAFLLQDAAPSLARRRPLQASQTQLCPLSNAISVAVSMCEGPQSVSKSGQVNLPALYTL